MSLQSPEAVQALANASDILQRLHAHLKAVGRFPHEGQARIIRAFFNEKKKIIQGQCGRSTGKTEAVLYITWRYALMNPGSEIYIICPEIKQAKKIYWLKKRLQNYGPAEFVLDVRESELRVIFTNGSYIILDGCENYEALRGIKPDLVIYDEFQHHTPFFDEEVMQPNLSSGKVCLLVFGTPPKRHCYYVDFRKNLLENIASGDKECFYIELLSESNPTLDKEWLRKKKAELIRKDKVNVWLREYEGRLVFDTESAIFPFLRRERHLKPHATVMKLIERDRKKLNWYRFYDPGTMTVFGGLFIAHNPYTSQIFFLDEIYADDRRECTTRAIWQKTTEICEDLYDNEDAWQGWYDEAAAWFANEVRDLFGVNLTPTQKGKFSAEHDEGRAGESLINMAMDRENTFIVSDRCQKFFWEMENYVLDEQGRYPRNHDHLVDLLFYFTLNTGYTLIEDNDPSQVHDETQAAKRGAQSIESMIAEKMMKDDPSELYGNEFFDLEPAGGLWN